MLNDKAKRIIENIYDIVMETDFKKEAIKEMHKDIKNKNVMVDKNKGIIEIQDTNGTLVLYTIKIIKGYDYNNN